MRFQLPEDLTALSADELSELATQADGLMSELSAIDDADFTDEQIDEFAAVAEGSAAIAAENERRETAATQRADRLAAARETAAGRAAAAEEASAETEEAASNTEEASSTETEETEGAVTASASQPVSGVAAVAASSSTGGGPALPSRTPAVIIAAADVPDHSTGADLDGVAGLAKAANAKMARLPKKPGNSRERQFNRYPVASISRGEDNFDGLIDTNPEFGGDFQALMEEAGREKRLPNGNLVAAGGWCAPSETIYDLCERETLDGIVDIPEVNITRGGLRFTQGPDFSQIFNDIGFCQTEAEAEAGTEKPCFDIPCPPFQEARLDACGLCIRAGILTNVGYPELVNRWISGGMTAHQHKMSIRTINEIADALGTAVPFPSTADDNLSATSYVLGAVEAIVNGQREAFRLSLTATLEVIAPYWLRSVIRADLANRNGVDLLQVTDSMIDAYFALRGARVQWVYGYQPLTSTNAGATDCADGYPESVELLVYPAGTFVKGVADIIQLDTIYDTAGLKENTYTGLFFEEAMFVAKTCHGGCKISVPLCINGRTGAADISACQLVGTTIS